MRLAQPSAAVVICTFALIAACGRRPIGSNGPDGGGADGAGKAGASGAAGKAGASGAAGKVGPTGAAGTGPSGPAGAAGTSPVAGTTGASGSNAAAGSSGAAGAPGPGCTPGETICTGPSQAVTCLPDGTWSTDNRFCSYGCKLNVCRECAPGDVICNSPMTIQRCPADGLRWSPPELCDNGCENGSCAPHCKPGVGECLTEADVHVCRGDGIWGATVTCKFGCAQGQCRTCQPYATECLTPTSSHQCNDDGIWGPATACATTCSSGICQDCQPDAGVCDDDKSFRSCSNNGTWETAAPCESGLCFGDSCRECKPGASRCLEGDVIQTCGSDGSWTEDAACPNTCKAGKCVAIPKKVFVTSTTYKGGDLGGLTGADAKCQARAMAAGLTGTFRAWLSDADGQPATRFTKESGPYLLVTGNVVANNLTQVTSGTLRHAINVTELGTPAPTATIPGCTTPIAWSNTTSDGYIGDPGSTCGDWTDSSVSAAWFGTTALQSGWTGPVCMAVAGASPATGCGALAPLFCFEQ
jgi:hypothetical protein